MQKLLARQFLAGANDPRHPPVTSGERPLLAALAGEVEANFSALDRDMLASEGREPVALIGSRIFVIADTDQRRLQKAHDRRQNLLARQAAQAHVLGNLGPDHRQRGGELQQVLVFRLLPRLAIFGVILVLLAPFGVAAGRLDVPVRRRADPDVRPGRRNDKGAYAVQRIGIRDPPAPRIQIDEAPARSSAPDRRTVIGHVAQAGRGRHGHVDGNTDLGIEHWARPAFPRNAGYAPSVPCESRATGAQREARLNRLRTRCGRDRSAETAARAAPGSRGTPGAAGPRR